MESALIALAQATPGGVAGGLGKASSVLQEFGTYSNLHLLQALRAEGALLRDFEAQGLRAPPPDHPVRANVRDAFYPFKAGPVQFDAWKRQVLSRGQTVIEQNIAWLGATDKP